MSNLKVDTVALLQGFYNARDDKKISNSFCLEITKKILDISFPGKFKRKECTYNDLLNILRSIESENIFELINLWEYIGNSISDGLSVANY